ncbi:hypothetical protein KKG41_04885 [Patescibacteria group bacterium]|nr:hypothetical protein [Patescibacteria group bacterium]MBU1890840.1 hypothetical protein [Patescibacteria group bacterium]
MSGPANPVFRPIGHNCGIQPMGPTPMGGQIHDTFNVTPGGNIFNGHTTAQIPGGQKIRMDWNPR